MHKELEKKKRFVIYTRCSTDEQAQGDYTTLDVQAHHCKHHLDALGYEAVRIIKDDGYSAGNLKRPGIQSILKEITPGNANRSFDGIIFHALDRLTRSMGDLYALVDLFKENNIDFISVRNSIDTSSATGRVQLGVMGLFSAFQRENTGERVKAAALARIRQGKWPASKLAYGYKRIADGAPLPNGRQPHKIVIDKPLAKELRAIWELAASNKSLLLIAKELEKRGIKSPEGITWRKQSIINILRNPFYKGYMRWNGEKYKGNQEALINADLWDRANKMLSAKLPKHRFAVKPKTYIYLLEGLIKCGKCGSRFISTHSLNGSSGKFYYYVCGRTKQGLGCDNKPLPAQTFDQAVIDYLKKSSSDPKILLQAIHQAIAEAKEKLSRTNKNLRNAGKKLMELREEAGKLLNLATKGVISKGVTYKSQMEKIEQEIFTLEEQIAKLNAQRSVASAAVESSSLLQSNIVIASKNLTTIPPEAQKSIIQSLIKEIVVYDDKLEMDLFTFAKPFLQQNLSGDNLTKEKRLTSKSKALTTNRKGLRIRKDWLPLVDSNHGPGGYT